MLTTARFALSGLLLFIAGFLLLVNACIVINWYWKRQHSSQVPVIGGLAGMAGILLMPLQGWRQWWWLPLVLDTAIAPGLIGVVFVYFKKPRR